MLGLAGAAAGVLVAPAFGASTGNKVNNCYGIWWTRDWNQECGGGGASQEGYYKTTADCTAPQAPDKSMTKYRFKGNAEPYDGADCRYGINFVNTVYW
ncbi:hypothetical protein QLQ12_07020 [Actinoplanes sp. NEAU-A12]|uniref:Uncharacterized protein n=1 Tax=Actinoplanes sandaracinus TaxID=3045177 RepID=A0ABT6WF34_9ACTN|nr:hypothetical protein [Actinoplanes sandaracinus]MDI6098352.1 hypothetical protein [Actinoplanes sandaracinus]